MTKRFLVLAALLGIFLVLAVTDCQSQGTAPIVWVSPSLVRVGQTDAPTSSKSIALSGARGEYLDSQIIVTAPSGGLSNANLTATNLTGPKGAVISNSNYSFYRELYVDVSTSSPNWGGSEQPLPTGFYTDPLLPFIDPVTGLPPTSATFQAVPFTVSAGQNQPIWIDLFIPRGTQNSPPGTYTGTITVSSTQGNVNIPVTVTLWNFELPLKPSLMSDFNPGGSTSHEIEQELLRHRVMPDTLSSTSDEPADINNMGLLSTSLPFYSGANYSNCKMSAAPSTAQFAAAKASHQSSLHIYDYSADEITNCTNIFPTLIQWAANMHAAGVDNFVTMAPTPALFSDGTGSGRSAVDIWVVEADFFATSSADIATSLAKGDKVWSYTTLVQDAYTPKWEIDFHPINFRLIPGWLNALQGLTGFLYWDVDDWSSSPYTNVYNSDYAGYPGEGQLVYPGPPAGLKGVAPSMRLKWIRDGVQDYEYAHILKNAGQTSFVNSVIQTVAPDWTNWTRNPATLEAARIQLGQKASGLSSGGAPNPPTGLTATAH